MYTIISSSSLCRLNEINVRPKIMPNKIIKKMFKSKPKLNVSIANGIKKKIEMPNNVPISPEVRNGNFD